MAKETIETMKKILLMGFVLIGVSLIIVLWVQGFSDAETSGSGLSGRTATNIGSSFSVTQTAILNDWATNQAASQQPVLSPTGTPTLSMIQSMTGSPVPTQSLTPDLTQMWNIDQGNS